MSYSRWSNSFWYTYWCVHSVDSGIPENRDNARFEICLVDDYVNFTAYELRINLERCLKVIWQKSQVEECDFAENLKRELRGYIKRFLKDVDETYPVYNNCVQTTPFENNSKWKCTKEWDNFEVEKDGVSFKAYTQEEAQWLCDVLNQIEELKKLMGEV